MVNVSLPCLSSSEAHGDWMGVTRIVPTTLFPIVGALTFVEQNNTRIGPLAHNACAEHVAKAVIYLPARNSYPSIPSLSICLSKSL